MSINYCMTCGNTYYLPFTKAEGKKECDLCHNVKNVYSIEINNFIINYKIFNMDIYKSLHSSFLRQIVNNENINATVSWKVDDNNNHIFEFEAQIDNEINIFATSTRKDKINSLKIGVLKFINKLSKTNHLNLEEDIKICQT